MQLKYRGVSYDYTPPSVEMKPTGAVGKYRGLEWRFRNPTKVPVLQPNLDLVYRGVPYKTGEVAATPTPVVAAASAAEPAGTTSGTMATASIGSSVKDLARRLMVSHHSLIKKREQSLLSRAAAEVGLGSDAADYWNPLQGKIRSSFRHTYDRSHVALS